MWFQNLVPSLEKEVEFHGSDGLTALLEPVLLMVSECTRDEYQSYLLPFLRNIFLMTKSIQVSTDTTTSLYIPSSSCLSPWVTSRLSEQPLCPSNSTQFLSTQKDEQWYWDVNWHLSFSFLDSSSALNGTTGNSTTDRKFRDSYW